MIPSSLFIAANAVAVRSVPAASRVGTTARAKNGRALHALLWRAESAADGEAPLFCVHGLTRNSWDFDVPARALCAGRRVIAPDMAGRGFSDNMSEAAQYNYGTYVADCLRMLDHLKIDCVDWLGTSMGGLIGMLIAAQHPARIRKLIVNDVGPFLPVTGLKRIGEYVGKQPVFPNMLDAERYCRATYADFGIDGADAWRRFAWESVDESSGSYHLRYDVRIAEGFKHLAQDVDMWGVYDGIRAPTLVLRGERSDILPNDVAEEMTRRGPKASLVTFARCGHAPALQDASQIKTIADFLRG